MEVFGSSVEGAPIYSLTLTTKQPLKMVYMVRIPFKGVSGKPSAFGLRGVRAPGKALV